MLKKNYTEVTEFILLGLTDRADLQPVLFVVFLVIYLITVIGNVGMILLIRRYSLDPAEAGPQHDSNVLLPQPPLLFAKSCTTLCTWYVHIPTKCSKNTEVGYMKAMPNFTDVTEFILLGLTSHQELQVLFFVVFLVVYMITLIGNIAMIILISISPQLQSPMYFFLSHLSFVDVWFSSNVTPEMLEKLPSETKTISYAGCLIACGGVHIKEYTMIVIAGINFTYSLSVVLISYTLIVAAVLRMRSADGRRKAFSTCGSHLTAVTMFYGTLIFMYLRRPTEESVEQGKMVAVFYTTVIPMLNPMIYSLRNKDVKEAVNKAIVKANLRQ
uniref:Uncharacterized protein n=1 Tax=Rangifer tarandus platyrhynchus TaxID=3082113 RepID=A0ACB0EGA0_RANTA|nr:unnamed protein product [Rangifer tarandus platyrhynchus]